MTKTQYLTTVIFVVVITTIAGKAFSLYQSTLPTPLLKWQVSNESNPQVIDHSLWQDILAKHVHLNVNNEHGFDYNAVSSSDKNKLTHYLLTLQKIDPRDYRKDEQLAYWVNLYNALIVNLVLTHYPLESVKDIGNGITGPWNIELATVANHPISLNNIEHGVLRPLWQDKRIHYVLNCASIGCPDLAKKSFASKDIDKQLDIAAMHFINQKKGVNFNDNTLTLSSIYHWFSTDFGQDQQALFHHLMRYAKPALKQQLKAFKGDAKFSYNWKLNNTSTGLLNNSFQLNIQSKKSS